MKLQNPNTRQGSALIIAITMVTIIAVMVGLGTLFNSTMMRNAHRSQTILQANALADGALEGLYYQWRTIAPNSPRNGAGTPNQITGFDPIPLDGVDQAYVQLVKPALRPTEHGLEYVAMDPGVAPDRARMPGGKAVPVYRAFTRISLPTTFGTLEMDVSQNFGYEGRSPTGWAILQISESYNDGDKIVDGELPVNPGQSMSVGEQHTNGNFYTGSSNLTMIGSATFGNEWEIGFGPNDTTLRGTPSSPNFTNDLPPVRGERVSFFNIDPQALELGKHPSERDTNPNNDSFREMLKKADPNFPDPLNPPGRESTRPYDQTPVRIAVDSTTGALNVFDIAGSARPTSDPLYQTIAKAIDPTLNIADIQPGFVLPQSAFTNLRDHRVSTTQNVKVTNLNIAVLAAALEGGVTQSGVPVVPDLSGYNFGPDNPDLRSLGNGWNGAIYIEDVTTSPKNATEHYANPGAARNHRGIRVTQGGRLPNLKRQDKTFVGLTVITPNPAYILGDFNTGATYQNLPNGLPFTNRDPLLVADDTRPRTTRSPTGADENFVAGNRVGTGYAHPDSPTGQPVIPPAAIMADAVTILSNGWKDANHTNGLSGTNARIATHTTVNTAIISGVVPSGAKDFKEDGQRAKYSGGAENFPRLLEKWDGRYFTYHGSMIMAYISEQAFYRWSFGSPIYTAPDRRWFHEANFRTITMSDGRIVNNGPPLLEDTTFTFPRTPKVIESIVFK